MEASVIGFGVLVAVLTAVIVSTPVLAGWSVLTEKLNRQKAELQAYEQELDESAEQLLERLREQHQRELDREAELASCQPYVHPQAFDPQLRRIETHRAGSGMNDDLEIVVLDEPGPGGANHRYAINYHPNPGTPDGGVYTLAIIEFQNGPIKEAGINGISNEALLAIVHDRLEAFQNGPFPCVHNYMAKINVGIALDWLKKRTKDRTERNVEGTTAA